MKKYLLSAVIIASFILYVVYEKSWFKRAVPQIEITTPEVTERGQYKDGIYAGNVADAFYGPLQVAAVIENGRIVDVKFLIYPNDRPTSIQVNAEAMPILKSETIRIQSGEVDIVSGATQTAEAFRITMGAALAQAK